MGSPVFLLEGLRENLLPHVFQLLETALIPHSSAPSSIFKASKMALGFSQASSSLLLCFHPHISFSDSDIDSSASLFHM